jgi:hypothetical protein
MSSDNLHKMKSITSAYAMAHNCDPLVLEYMKELNELLTYELAPLTTPEEESAW